MRTHPPQPSHGLRVPAPRLLAGLSALLAACGGGGGSVEPPPVQAAAVTTAVEAPGAAPAVPASAGALALQPSFHLAPVILDEPDAADASDNQASAHLPAHRQAVPAAQAGLATRGLTLQALQAAGRAQALAAPVAGRVAASLPAVSGASATSGPGPEAGTLRPQASGGTVATYTPAQIRAAYGLPALPVAAAGLSAAQAAQLGAGQTVYIVDAMHDPNVAAELGAFNQKFGLPTCSALALSASAKLPLAAASASAGCSLSVVFATAAGGLGSKAPPYDSGWATEIALDVQWAHATAPLARIVLIESPDASFGSLLGAVKLANAMGPGVVSMSFGNSESSSTAAADSVFSAAGMSYLAATGDAGAGVSWPAASARVLAVGGTTMNYSGSGARSERAWAQTGGGISRFTATPGWQNNSVPGLGTLSGRGMADVAFNADPSTGQYVALLAPGAGSVSWVSAGGTSLSTPQWAGLVAVANALRAQVGSAAIGLTQPSLYGPIASVPGSYAAAFLDVVAGSDGSCSGCSATIGYDLPSGLGTPNASALLAALSGSALVPAPVPAPMPVAPVVSAAAVTAKVGTALSYKVSVTASNALAFSLSGAPAGMVIDASGTLAWPKPAPGSYAVTVSAKDKVNGLIGQGLVTVSVAQPLPPVISAAAVSGTAGQALSASFTVTDPGGYAMTVSVSGAPAGMSFSSSGPTLTMQWAKPVQGSYRLVIAAKNTLGLSSQASVAVTIAKGK